MIIREIKGDLFKHAGDAPYSFAHCVSADLKMGAGIAVQFKQLYGTKGLAEQKVVVGGVAHMKINDGEAKDNAAPSYVFHLVTKERYNQKPTYKALESSLVQLCILCLELGVKTLCMPQIGCGLDKLKWNKVLGIITEVFRDSGISVNIYYL